MAIITATINEKGEVTLSNNILGNAGEHNSRTIKFFVPSSVTEKTDYFRLWIDGVFSEKIALDSSTGIAEFTVPQAMLKPPVVRMQLVGYKSVEGILTFVWKSNVFKLSVNISVETTEFVPKHAYDPLEEALIQCSDTIENMNGITSKLQLSSDSLNSTLKHVEELRKEMSEDLKNAENRVNDVATVYNECLKTKNECIAYGIYKVTTPEEIENGENSESVATSGATKKFVKNNINGLIGKAELADDNIKFLSGESSEAPNTEICSVSLNGFAKTEQLNALAGSVFNIKECYNFDELNYFSQDTPEVLTVGDVYVTKHASTYNPDQYEANELYIWNGKNWTKLGIVEFLKQYVNLKTNFTVDQTFSGGSENAQSGKAVWEIINSNEYLSNNVDSSDKPVRSKAVLEALNEKQNKKVEVVFNSGGEVELCNNVEYYFENINELKLTYPKGMFECWLNVTFAENSELTVELPNSKYIGAVPNFANGETWEISVKNGVVAAQKVIENV